MSCSSIITTTPIITLRLTFAIGNLLRSVGEAAFGLESIPAVGYHAVAVIVI